MTWFELRYSDLTDEEPGRHWPVSAELRGDARHWPAVRQIET